METSRRRASRGTVRCGSGRLGTRLALCLAVAFAGTVSGQETFTDDFERLDVSPPDGWTVSYGGWGIVDGELANTATTVAPGCWVWAGDPPVSMKGDLELAATVAFGPSPGDAVGRHGGLIFFASRATQRGDPLMTGYTLDWIDRATDYGLRLHRVDRVAAASVLTPLWLGTPELTDIPESWIIQVEGDTIRVLAGEPGAETEVFSVVDATYREGYLGVWANQNNVAIRVDDLDVSWTPPPLVACFTASATKGIAPLTVDFDASCTESIHGVSAWEWDFGDGEMATGAVVSHEFLFGGSYMVTLTVRDTTGLTDATSITVEPVDSTAGFSDDFERPDGPVDGWTVFRGTWDIADGRLVTTTAGVENWAWAGDPAYVFPANFTLTFTYEFTAVPPDAIGRHGGVMFCATKPTHRWDRTAGDAISGYTIDWIDRAEDRGIRLVRWDAGFHTTLMVVAGSVLPDPPREWQILVEGEVIRVFGDGVVRLEAVDATHRNGHFGCWAYGSATNVQSLAIDDVEVTSPSVNPCFAVLPESAARPGEELTFDGGCSSATGTPIVSYRWDFGDGATAEGKVAKHAYAAAGSRTATLTIETEGALTGSTSRTVDVWEPVESFEDDFERPDGPPSGWTAASGEWNVVDGILHVEAPIAADALIWAGDPPVRFGGFSSIEVDVRFLDARPGSNPGRHGGILFFARRTESRQQGNSGYMVDWLDWGNVGFRIHRIDSGVATPLFSGTPGLADPGTAWRVEVDGEVIRLLVDGALVAEVVDGTYRAGFFGLWRYAGVEATGFPNAMDFDDIRIGEGSGPVKPIFHRGDADADGNINITDGIFVLNYLFLGGGTPPCQEAANADDDTAINITDAIYILNFLFLGGNAPPAPGPTDLPCGPDPVDSENDLGCESYTSC